MEFLKLWKIEKTFQSGSSDYKYTTSQGEGSIQALHINLTDLTELTGNESFWSTMRVKIQLLDVLHNRLQALPCRLSEYSKSLEVVGCAFNSFHSIPEVLFSCSNLQNINLYYNQVHFVDSRIGQLHCLSLLDLGKNKIDILPDVFNTLPNLQIFVLEGNFLSAVPSSFSKLQCLNTLSLADNMLKEFPSAIVDLYELKTLNLHYNRIQYIPDGSVPFIQRLQDITIQGNPLQDQSLLTMGTEQMQEYLSTRSPQTNFEKTKNFRILVVGECGSGKTSLVEALCKEKYVAPFKRKYHDHTVGINCYKFPVCHQDKSFDISVWDFGGEKSYSMMNQLFLSDNTLVWIVVNAQNYDYVRSVKSWLKAVLSTCDDVDLTIIVTHCDEINSKEALQKITSDISTKVKMDLQDYIEGDISEEFPLSGTSDDSTNSAESESRLVHCAKNLLSSLTVIQVTNAFPLTGHEELKRSVRDVIDSKKKFDLLSPLPSAWSEAEQLLLQMSETLICQEIPSVMKAVEVAEVLTGLFNDGCDCKNFLQYLHQAGEILIFESPRGESQQKPNQHDQTAPNRTVEKNSGLSSTSMVVLRPSWLVFVLKTIFCHDFCDNLKKHDFALRLIHQARRNRINLTKDDITFYADTLTEHGMIPLSLLKSMWFNFGIGRHTEFLLFILKKVGIAFRNQIQNPQNCLDEVEDESKCTYLFPWLLKEGNNDGSACCCYTSTDQKALVIKYSFTAVPFGLFERYLVNLHSLRDIVFENTRRHHIEAIVAPEKHRVHVHHIIDECTSDIIISCLPNEASDQPVWNTVSKFICVLNNHLKLVHCSQPSQYVQCPNNIDHLIRLKDFMGHSIRKPVVCNTCLKTSDKGILEPWMYITAEGRLFIFFLISNIITSVYISIALTNISGMPVDNLSRIVSTYIDANNPLEEPEINELSTYIPPFMWKKLQNVLLPGRLIYDDEKSLDPLEEKLKTFRIILKWTELNPCASMATFLRTVEHSSLSKDDRNRIFVSVLVKKYDLQ